MNLTSSLLCLTLLSFATCTSAQIGVSYAKAMTNFEFDFNLKRVGVDPKTSKMVGQSKDGIAVIELVGDLDELSSASLMIAVPNDSEAARSRNGGRLLRFVQNTVPEWKGSTSWINGRLRKIAKGDFSDDSTTVGGKRVTMTTMKDGALILTTVERK